MGSTLKSRDKIRAIFAVNVHLDVKTKTQKVVHILGVTG